MIQFLLLFNRQAKIRLQMWFISQSDKMKKNIAKELSTMILMRHSSMSNFIEWKDLKIVYNKYASLYFCFAIEKNDNELLTLEIIYRCVELLDLYFVNVCELDIIYNFEKAYYILNEFLFAGEIQETNKMKVLEAIVAQDAMDKEEEVN